MAKRKRVRSSSGESGGRGPAGAPSGAPSGRAYGAALLLLALMVGAAFIPAYRARVFPTLNKIERLPQRVTVPLETIQERTKKADYGFVSFARSHMFEDAVVLISDDPRDGALASKLWLAYYLYPRVLVTTEALVSRSDPGVDFVLATPNFRPEPWTDASSGHQLVPVSPRAIEYARTRGNR